MRFAQVDEDGKVVGSGNADAEHFEHAAERGEILVELPDDAPVEFAALQKFLDAKKEGA